MNNVAAVGDGPLNDQPWDYPEFPLPTIPAPGSIPLQPPQQHLDADASRDRAKQGARERLSQLGMQPA